jgi:hypothetical protein
MSGKWKPQQLETFVWNCGSVDLQCDKNVCNVLRKAKVVEICSHGIQQDFVLSLLSQPSLIKVKVPYFLEPKDRQKVDIPRLNLPNLTDLTLAFPLLDGSEYEKEKVFFQQLEVPSLQRLWLGSVKSPLYLGHLGSLPDLKVLDIGTFGYADDQAEDVEISVDLLLQNIYRWDSIEELSLRVGGERGSDFTNQLVSTITPLSRENVMAGWKNSVLFPNLKRVRLSRMPEAVGDLRLSMVNLASFVASRKALNRKVSIHNVFLSINGDFEACEEPESTIRFTTRTLSDAYEAESDTEAEGINKEQQQKQNQEQEKREKDESSQICCVIESIDIAGTLYEYLSRDEEVAFEWLSENLIQFKTPSQ